MLIILAELSPNNIETIEGKFYDTNDDSGFYQFRSDDDSVWWVLTEEEIGEIPSFEENYTLTYSDRGTTECHDCPEEWDCECELYDDEFIKIIRKGN